MVRDIPKAYNLSAQMAFQIDRAVEIIKAGGIVAFPTDTVYGLGADVFNSEAAERIYEVKQRPRHLPLPILLADMKQVAAVAGSVSGIALFLMEHFWPGGLTLVLPKATSLPDNITAGSDKVAIRIPDHIVPLTIISRLESPIIGTSANISDKPSAVTPQEVEQQLGSKVDLIVNGGNCPGGLESTVVDVTGTTPAVLRQGIIPEDEINKACHEYVSEGR